MRLILYTRVSSQEQATGGVSLDAQEARGRAWADLMGHTVVSVARDEGVSATNAPLERPKFRDATVDLQRGLADGLFACALDRIARSVIDTLELIEIFDDNKWTLLSMRESLDTSNAVGRLMVTMLAGFAEFERNLISNRTKEGMDQVRREGRVYTGKIPYGKRATPDRLLVDDPLEQECLRRLIEYRTKGMTAVQIAAELNKWHAHPRLCVPWTAHHIDNMSRGLLRQGITRHRVHKLRKSPKKRATLPPVP